MSIPAVTFCIRNFNDKLIKIVKDWRLIPFYFRTYIFNRSKTAAMTFLISYPKCGRTWLRMILVKYLSDKNGLQTINFSYLEDHFGFVFEHDQSTWVPFPKKASDLSVNRKKYHNKSIIFLARDPRDILVSSWHHLTYREKIYKDSLSIFIQDPRIGLEKIITFMNLWINIKDCCKMFLLIRYEDLKNDPKTVIRQILQFMEETEIEEQKLDHAIQFGSIQNMKKMESDGTFDIPWLKPGNKKDSRSFKTRKGVVGDWKNYFTDSDIKYVEQVISESLSSEFGYG